jgi:geranylgeranyl diphosphate synthase type I
MTLPADLQSPLRERRDAVETVLRAHVERASASGLPLYRMMQYQLGWVDRDGLEIPGNDAPRTYGSLCIEAALTVDPNASGERGGTAVELFFESANVHEVMQTGDAGSDLTPAVWWVWGPAQAINVGDGLHALARLAILRERERGGSPDATLDAMNVLDDLALRYYEGQYIELTYQERIDITLAQYSTMARSKLGALLGGSAALGARIAGASVETANAFWEFGSTIGEAAQVRADINALWNPGPKPPGRVLNKSKLYPVVDVLEHGALAHKRAVGTIYFKRVMEAPDIAELAKILDGAGAHERSEARVTELIAEATAHFDNITSDASIRERWRSIITGLVNGDRAR